MCLELYCYAQFFEMILYRVAKNMVKQCVTVIEWKHIFGGLFNDDGPVSIRDEIAIFEKIQKIIQAQFPLF